jgi:4-hydroxy-3-methylbut-2-enyl diphosphate reductase
MKVWKRVRGFAKDGITSIIHGKSDHEETRATASRAAGEDGKGHCLIVLTLADIDYVCEYLEMGGDPAAFRERFRGEAMSEGFDPDLHLTRVGVANQRSEEHTSELQSLTH